jgi:hypothetical protein
MDAPDVPAKMRSARSSHHALSPLAGQTARTGTPKLGTQDALGKLDEFGRRLIRHAEREAVCPDTTTKRPLFDTPALLESRRKR